MPVCSVKIMSFKKDAVAMCGIAGVVYFDGREPRQELLERMVEAVGHRGPDDRHYWTGPGAGLGFNRLSIIDVQDGRQPMSNEEDTLWIVFNGEIYNYPELRAELIAKGHRFKTRTDTEVILHLYEEYGEGSVLHLRGMFSFVVWDRSRRQCFAARDHFGIKPFYYYCDSHKLLFASEIKSILQADGFPAEVKPDSLYHYLTYQYVPEPETMFENIYKLPPAHTLSLDGRTGKMTIRRYWEPMFEPTRLSRTDCIDGIREKLAESVSRHMQSDVSRGCFLSSGIDSTAIASYLSRIEPIKTFSVGFEGPRDETVVSGLTARSLGTEHYAKMITSREFFEAVPKAVWHQDEPVADPSAIALYHVAELAHRHVTVVLSGEGADELFGGYRIYREPNALRPVAWLPQRAKRLINRLASRLPDGLTGRNYLLRGTTPIEERFIGNARIYSEAAKRELLLGEEPFSPSCGNSCGLAGEFYERCQHLDPVSRMQYIDLNLWLPGNILMKADKMTMAHSLELRVPFLDKELFEFVRQIPASYRIARGTTKHILRQAMEGVVPDFVRHRPKLGFPVPLRDWLHTREGDWMVEQIEGSGSDMFFSKHAARTMLEKHRRGMGDYSRRLWVLYIFSLWYSTFIREGKNGGMGGKQSAARLMGTESHFN